MMKIDIPPPTISGKLHIGHIYSYTQADIIKRYSEYSGDQCQYRFGIDNNGLPTAKLASKEQRTDIHTFSLEKGMEYKEQFRKFGINFNGEDYDTMSEETHRIAYEAFEILKNKGVAYKAEEEYLYSEKLKTSVSQFELNKDGLVEKNRRNTYNQESRGLVYQPHGL